MSATAFPDLFEALRAPFAEGEVKERRAGGGRMLSYITARTVMNRLDEVLGPENWWDEYKPLESAIICRLTIRLPDGRELSKTDAGGFAGMESEEDNEKSGYSDAFKRAAVKFGVARYLYRDGVPQNESLEPERPAERRQAPEQRRHTQHFPPAPDVPQTGRQLFGWIKEAEQRTGQKILSEVNSKAKHLGITGRTIDWSPGDVARLWPLAQALGGSPSLPIESPASS